MKGASLFMMVLLLVLAVPLMAVPAQGNTGVELSATSIMNIEEVQIEQDVSAPFYFEVICILPDDKQKSFVPLEFIEPSKSRSNNNDFVMNNGHTHIRKRRIKSGRH